MPRANPSRLPFHEIVRLVKHHLELAGSRGLTKRDLLAKIGPTRTSLATIQRALNHLRNDLDAQLRCFGKVHRWAFETILTLPLDEPDREDLVLLHVARAAIRPFLDPRMYERIEKILEGFDDRARRRTSPRDLPPPRAVSSSGDALGISKAVPLPAVAVLVVEPLRVLSEAIVRYALQLIALADNDPGKHDAVVGALSPIDEFRAQAARRVSGDDDDEQDDVEDDVVDTIVSPVPANAPVLLAPVA